MYFSYGSSGDTVHVALVEYCGYTADGAVNVHVIEGNNPDRVAARGISAGFFAGPRLRLLGGRGGYHHPVRQYRR